MENKIHESLYYEQRRITEAELQLAFLNNVVWDTENAFGEEFVKDKVNTYGCGLELKDLTKEEYAQMKEIISKHCADKDALKKLSKESNHYKIQMGTQVVIGYGMFWDNWEKETKKKPIDMTIAFKWGIPDTCEIIDVVDRKEITDEVFTDEEGRTFHKTITKKLQCNKPLLEAVFDNQVSADA